MDNNTNPATLSQAKEETSTKTPASNFNQANSSVNKSSKSTSENKNNLSYSTIREQTGSFMLIIVLLIIGGIGARQNLE
jgi:hypothetical protein